MYKLISSNWIKSLVMIKVTMLILRIVIATSIILVGLSKILISSLAFILNEKTKEKLVKKTFLGTLINRDKTFAGINIDLVILFFGVYTCIHGLVMLKIMPTQVSEIFTNYLTHIVVFFVFGAYCIIFYSLVLYTQFIHKDFKNVEEYSIFGIGGGLLLFASAPISIIINNIIHENTPVFSVSNQLLLLLSFFFCWLFILDCIYVRYKINSKVTDIITLSLTNLVALFF